MPHEQAQQCQQKGAVQPGNGKQMAHACLGKAVGQFLGNAAAISQKLCLQESSHGAVVGPHPGDPVPEGFFHPLGQVSQGAGLALGHSGHLIAVQQGEDAPGGEGGQLRALDDGGILPVGVSQKSLPRLQEGGGFVAEIALGLGTPGIRQAHHDPPAGIPLLRPVTHCGGKQVAGAALFLYRLRYQGAPAPAIQQPCRQGQGDQGQIDTQPPAGTQSGQQQNDSAGRRQNARCPKDPLPHRQQAQGQDGRCKGKRDGCQ